MSTATKCRGCGLQVSPLARFCFVCRAPDPLLRSKHAGEKPAANRLWLIGGIGALAWFATCVGLWAAWVR